MSHSTTKTLTERTRNCHRTQTYGRGRSSSLPAFARVLLLGALLALLAGTGACDPVSSGALSVGGSSIVSNASVAMKSTINELHGAVDEQRGKLKADTLEVLEQAELSASRLAASTGAIAGALEERTANDVKATIDRGTASLRELTAAVRAGVDESIRQAAQQAKALLDQSHAIVRDALESVRPLIAQAKAAGDELVWKTEGALSTLLLRVLAGALIVLAAIPAVWAFVTRGRTEGNKSRSLVVLGVGLAIGVGLFVFAPNVSALTASEHRVTNFERDCATMEQQGPELLALSANNQPVSKELAAKVRDAALTCQTFASNPTQAASAERYVLAALRASGAAAVCRASWQCPPEHVCETSTGECLRYGVYCTTPQHCGSGNECDLSRNRCVAREGFACSGPNSCQADETCHERRCVLLSKQLGKPCRVDGTHGICEAGSYKSDGRGGLLCKSNKEAQSETCNGLDDNCNGGIDDGLQEKDCIAAARGACRVGKTACRDGKPACIPALSRAETCGNNIDEDCDGYLDNASCPVQEVKPTPDPLHFGVATNCTELKLGGMCPHGHVRWACEVTSGPNDGNTWLKTAWVSNDPHDCGCKVWCSKNYFADNTWEVRILSRPEPRRAPR